MKITRNRAQCRLCLDIIESKHRHDYVSCKCNSISIDGGPQRDDGSTYVRCSANDFNNIIWLDDEL